MGQDFLDASMFVGQGGNTELLAYLENNLPLLGDEDRDFVLGCKMTLEIGGVLTAENTQRLRQIAKGIQAAGHDVLGGGVEPPLSPVKVLKDLVQNIHTLNAQEKTYANNIAKKLKKKEPLTPKEVEGLLQIYFDKGF